jgi:hypothetical protein
VKALPSLMACFHNLQLPKVKRTQRGTVDNPTGGFPPAGKASWILPKTRFSSASRLIRLLPRRQYQPKFSLHLHPATTLDQPPHKNNPESGESSVNRLTGTDSGHLPHSTPSALHYLTVDSPVESPVATLLQVSFINKGWTDLVWGSALRASNHHQLPIYRSNPRLLNYTV